MPDVQINLLEDKFFGFIYEDGSYSETREPRAATCVPRRPRDDAQWDFERKCWCVDGVPVTQAQPMNSLVENLSASGPVAPLTVDDVLEKLTPEQYMELLAKLATQQQSNAGGEKTLKL